MDLNRFPEKAQQALGGLMRAKSSFRSWARSKAVYPLSTTVNREVQGAMREPRVKAGMASKESERRLAVGC